MRSQIMLIADIDKEIVIMKFIKCHIANNCAVIIDDKTEVERGYNSVIEEVRNGPQFSGYLFYPGDKPDAGIPIDPHVSRERYLERPAMHGVCIYKSWNGRVNIE